MVALRRVALFEGAVHDGGLWRRRVAFWPPASDAANASGPVKRALSGVVLPGPLEAMNLTLSGLTGEVGRQGSLLPEVRQRERLREALAQLEALEGPQAYLSFARGGAMVADTGEADGLRPLRFLNQPRRVQVEADAKGQPCRVELGGTLAAGGRRGGTSGASTMSGGGSSPSTASITK